MPRSRTYLSPHAKVTPTKEWVRIHVANFQKFNQTN